MDKIYAGENAIFEEKKLIVIRCVGMAMELTHERFVRYRGLTLNYNGLSIGINSDKYVRHPFQNILAHDWIKDQRQFPVIWGGIKPNIQYSTNKPNQYTQYGN